MTDPDALRRVFTVEETAAVCGISRDLATTAISQGLIPAIQIGRRVVVPADALVDWLNTEALRQSAERRAGSNQPWYQSTGPGGTNESP